MIYITACEKALHALANTIEATGGVPRNEDGTFSPAGDPDWIDLADVYLAACTVLNRTPLVAECAEEEE